MNRKETTSHGHDPERERDLKFFDSWPPFKAGDVLGVAGWRVRAEKDRDA